MDSNARPPWEEDEHLPVRLDREARMVRAIYIDERRRFETLRSGSCSLYQPARLYDGIPAIYAEGGKVLRASKPPIWPTLVRKFVAADIDPLEYIRTQFAQVDVFEGAWLEPHQLFSPRCREVWEREASHRGDEIRQELATQQNIAANAIATAKYSAGKSSEWACGYTLTNLGLELSSLFRYCFAVRLGGPEFLCIAKQFEMQAAIQYQQHKRHYKEHWQAILPAGWDELSRQVYDGTYKDLLNDTQWGPAP